MKRRPVLWITLGAAGLVAILVAVLASSGPASQVSAASPLVGKAAPGIQGKAINGTGDISLSQLSGKWVLVNFSASWCVPCQQEMPQLLAFSNQHASPHDAVVLTVAYDEQNVSGLASFLRSWHASWPAVDDGSAVVNYGIGGLPESYLLDPAGTVVAKYVGEVNAAQLDSVIASAEGATASRLLPTSSNGP
jgi:cytochrome c biogenesis protein CcmG/thiol:disulfide interchange protein DsbE